MDYSARTIILKLIQRSTLFFAVVLTSLTIVAPSAHGQTYHTPIHVGVRCQADYQNGWAPMINAYGPCSSFNNQISSTDYLDFYFNLHGGAAGFTNGNAAETCNGCGGVDSVDLFLVNTHGSIAYNDQSAAGYAMWDTGTLVWSPDMRFGSAGKQVKVFSTFSCDTLKTSDGLFWGRQGKLMSGG